MTVSGRLILVSGIGSVLGPLVGTTLMARYDINGVLYPIAAAALLLALLASDRSLSAVVPRHLQLTFRIMAQQAASLTHDPRDVSDEENK